MAAKPKRSALQAQLIEGASKVKRPKNRDKDKPDELAVLSSGVSEPWDLRGSPFDLGMLDAADWDGLFQEFGAGGQQLVYPQAQEESLAMLADEQPALGAPGRERGGGEEGPDFDQFVRDLDEHATWDVELQAIFACNEQMGPVEAAGRPAVKVQVPTTVARAVTECKLSPADRLRQSLEDLGYTNSQAQRIPLNGLNEVIKHHDALIRLEFSHSDICNLSKRPELLGILAQKFDDLMMALPFLTHEQVIDTAMKSPSAEVLPKVLDVCAQLQATPLCLPTSQILNIAKLGGCVALEELASWDGSRPQRPVGFKAQATVDIACNVWGAGPLPVKEQLCDLQQSGLTVEQVVAIASQPSGELALTFVKRYLNDLTHHGLTVNQVVGIASHRRGAQALDAVKMRLLDLRGQHLTVEQVVDIASHSGGASALEAVNEYLLDLTNAGATLTQVLDIAGHRGGGAALEAVHEHLPILIRDPYRLGTCAK